MNKAGVTWLLLWAGLGVASAAPALTMHGEVRMRHDSERHTLLRAVGGADWRLAPAVRVFGQLGTGQAGAQRAAAGANFQNDASVQQLFVELGGAKGGAILGRQEFADGPRQLVSVSDGPNLHRTWNGLRAYALGTDFRLGAYEFRATKLGRGWFDEDINSAERLRGVNASFSVAGGILLEPFWMHAAQRGTVGARWWRKQGDVRFDWTLARQDAAWAVFAAHSVALSKHGWQPRLTGRVDVASATFHQLYASSSYLGEGQFFSLRNLLMVTPGLTFAPGPGASVSFEHSVARRLKQAEPAYAGAMRARAGTRQRAGRDIGGLWRLAATWPVSEHVALAVNVERFAAGDLVRRAGHGSGSHAYLGATIRF